MFPRYRRVVGFAFGLIIVIIVLLIYIMAMTTETNPPPQKRTSVDQEYYNRRGIHVIVGHYLGESSAQVPNLTKELINSNMYHPIAGTGENGSPVQIPSMEIVKMRQLYPINRFNLLASDRISINRSLPDPRKKDCIGKYDYRGLPDTSIIIVFHNEAWSTLLRTVYSAINRSPPTLIKEILLVDDASNRDFLKKPLDDFVAQMPTKVRVLRSQERIGLTRARMLGAREAKGKVLTFLDAHCECTIGWLEPLLSRVAEDRKKVVCPVIDIINDDTFAYIRSFDFHWGAFNWELHFRWYSIGRSEMEHRKKDLTEPFRTPAMAGGLFSMDREYFFELGGYDEDLEIWGGENLEMSFRVWMCGGSVEIAPCSHVAHLFRKSSPYSFPNGVTHVLYGNLARVALVWMDQWREFFFKFNPEAAKIRNDLNVKQRLQLRYELNCHSFKWYLDHIWPQHFLPTSDRFFGKIRHMPSGRCLQRPSMSVNGGNHPTELPSIAQCNEKPSLKQMFLMSPEGFIMTDESLCLVATSKVNLDKIEYTIRMLACSGNPKQKWKRIKKNNAIQHVTYNKCLEYLPEKNLAVHLVLKDCDTNSIDQQWELDPVTWK